MEVQSTEDYTVFDPDDNKPKAIIVSIDAIQGVEKYWEDYAKSTGTTILPYNRNQNDWIWCDNRLPTAEEAKYELEILVAELDHGEDPTDPNAHWCIDDDRATYVGDGQGYAGSDWFTDNDWDEGQPWAVVAWRPIRKLPDVDRVKYRDLKWLNVKKVLY